jgi:hypothetical protein
MKRLFTGIAIGAMMIAGTTSVFAENEVNQRQQNQQKRIANGISNGTMNARQASKVENQEANVHREIRTDRAANGGKLTPAEHAQVNRQQNRMSNEIYNDKH